MFFLDNPTWPVAGDNLYGHLTLLGVGRCVFWAMGTGILWSLLLWNI